MADKAGDDETLEQVSQRLQRVATALARLEKRLDRMDARLDDLARRRAPETARDPVADPSPQHRDASPRSAAAPDPAHEPEPMLADPRTWRRVASTPPDAPPTPSAEPTPRVRPARRDLETLVGGNLLAKVGIAVLVIGVVFLLKLAFDQGWIGPRMRVMLGIAGGLGLALTGELLWRSDRAGRLYPQVLAGGGVAIAYFTVYAAYALEDYRALLNLSIELASSTLAALAAGLTAYAYWRRTPVLAGQAVLLGALAIVFGGTWVPFAIAYAVLLALGVSAVAASREWEAVAYMALLAPLAALLLPALGDSLPPVWTTGAVVLVGLVAVGTAFARAWPGLGHTSVAAVHVFVALVAVVAELGPASLGLLALFAAATLLAATRRDDGTIGCATAGAFLLAMATFTGRASGMTMQSWSILIAAAVLLAIAAAATRRWPMMGGIVILAAQVPIVALLLSPTWSADGTGSAWWFLGAWLVIAGAVAAYAWFVDHPATIWISAAAMGVAVSVFTLEADLEQASRVAAATVAAIVLTAASTPRAWVYGGVSAAILAGWTLLIAPDAEVTALVGAAVLPLLVVPFAMRGDVFDRGEGQTLGVAAATTVIGGALLALRTIETIGQPSWRGPVVGIYAVVALAAVAWRAATREARIGWGAAGLVLAAAWPPVQFDGSATAISWTLMLAVMAAVLLFRPRPWATVPMLVFAGLASGHVAFVTLDAIDSGATGFAEGLLVVSLLTLALVFAWAVLLVRSNVWPESGDGTAQQWLGLMRQVPLVLGTLMPVLYLSTILRGGWISVAWAVEATLFVAAGFIVRQKELRLAGLALFGLVLGRIAFVDVQGFEPVYRVITFMGVGALLLVVSFLYAWRRKGTPAEEERTPDT